MFNWLEKHPFFFAVVAFIVLAFAGIIEIIPNFAKVSRPLDGTRPYTVLEIAGKNSYIANACNSCHSQLIRPFKSETDRYGMYSMSGEYAYDRPFLWGSERTGPDLHRVANYRTTSWHEYHFLDPKAVSPGSIMPPYPFLFTDMANIKTAYSEVVVLKKVFNVPYGKNGNPSYDTWEEAKQDALKEAATIANSEMKSKESAKVKESIKNGKIPEVVALIAYLNRRK